MRNFKMPNVIGYGNKDCALLLFNPGIFNNLKVINFFAPDG